jgi:hypothetical protein
MRRTLDETAQAVEHAAGALRLKLDSRPFMSDAVVEDILSDLPAALDTIQSVCRRVRGRAAAPPAR